MATVQVNAEKRTAGNKGVARQLRMQGRIPAIIYAAGEENVPVALDSASFEQMLRHISSGNQILEMRVGGDGGSSYNVLIKEVQRNPVDQRIIHVDLQHISMTHKVRVQVPIHLTGTAFGVKEGGVLEHLLREIEVECLPSEIPQQITLDVSALDRGQSIHVRDISVPNVQIHETGERVVVTVVGKAKEEEAAPVVAAEGAAAEGAAPAAGEKDEKEKDKGKEKKAPGKGGKSSE
jgi:large subunit ribosomal protein L25